MLGAYYIDFSKLSPLRFIAYYSYNWYLWHPIFVIFITSHLGNTKTGLLVYIIISFLTAMIATIFIEEFFLNRRSFFLDKIFKQPSTEIHKM